MLDLAATRTAGVHPYLVTPEHTRWRPGRRSGPMPSSRPSRASCWRPIPSRHVRSLAPTSPRYFDLPNYTNNWKRLGFTDDEIADNGSDRLIDALVVWGDEATIAARVQEHRDAGASHVCIQVLTENPRIWRWISGASSRPFSCSYSAETTYPTRPTRVWTLMVTLLGWIGALLALLAYAQTRASRLRQIALLSSVALLTFNVLLGIWSNVALELALAIVNVRRLVQLRDPAEQTLDEERRGARRVRVRATASSSP